MRIDRKLSPLLLIIMRYYFSDDENITNPKVTIDQEDLDFDISLSVDIQTDAKLSTEFPSRSNQDDTIKIDKMMNRVTMDEEVDTDSVDVGSMPIFKNSRHIDVQIPPDNDFSLWAGDTSARRSPEG